MNTPAPNPIVSKKERRALAKNKYEAAKAEKAEAKRLKASKDKSRYIGGQHAAASVEEVVVSAPKRSQLSKHGARTR